MSGNKVELELQLKLAERKEIPQLHRLQLAAFSPLLTKYQDVQTNPACESLKQMLLKSERPANYYYKILLNQKIIGGIRLVLLTEHTARLGPLFIEPTYANQGYGQLSLLALEKDYSDIKCWQLDTIKQETNLLYFYQKLGYQLTGTETFIKDNMSIVELHKHIE